MQISYFKDESGNYIVTLVGYSQTIVVLAGHFRKVTEMQGNVVVGCGKIDFSVIAKLGFIVPEVADRNIV